MATSEVQNKAMLGPPSQTGQHSLCPCAEIPPMFAQGRVGL